MLSEPILNGLGQKTAVISRAVLFCFALQAAADTEGGLLQVQTIHPARDNTLFEVPGGDISNGAGPYLFSGRIRTLERRRALLKFDFSELPAGANIVDARLELTMSRTIAPSVLFRLNRMTVDWGEAGSDSGSPGGQGAPAQSGDATWLYAFFSDLLWSTEGGDFEPLVSADAIVGDDGLYLWQSPQLISDVTGWYGDPATNHGWLLRAEESALDTTAKRFNSREHPDQETWPRLIITFSPPPPLPVPALSALTLALLVFIVGWSGFWHRQRVTPQGKIGDQQF